MLLIKFQDWPLSLAHVLFSFVLSLESTNKANIIVLNIHTYTPLFLLLSRHTNKACKRGRYNIEVGSHVIFMLVTGSYPSQTNKQTDLKWQRLRWSFKAVHGVCRPFPTKTTWRSMRIEFELIWALNSKVKSKIL